jgi:hypothetical protein
LKQAFECQEYLPVSARVPDTVSAIQAAFETLKNSSCYLEIERSFDNCVCVNDDLLSFNRDLITRVVTQNVAFDHGFDPWGEKSIMNAISSMGDVYAIREKMRVQALAFATRQNT